MALFWKRVVELDANLINSVVYFCPSTQSSMPCVINDDGTVSPSSFPSFRFDCLKNLANAWKTGELGGMEDCKFPQSKKYATFAFDKDFFFKPGRKEKVGKLLYGRKNVVKPRSDDEVAKRPCPGTENGPSNEAPKKPCPGIDHRRYEEVIKNRKWDSSRTFASPVIFDHGLCRSRHCDGQMSSFRTVCYYCAKAIDCLRSARQYLKKPLTDGERRLLKTPNRYLTTDEANQKLNVILRKKNDAIKKLRKKKRQVGSLTKELDSYRPKAAKDRKSVRSVVKYFELEEQKLRSPTCLWMKTENDLCNHKADSISMLGRHMKEEHFLPQVEENREMPTDERCYECLWKGCRRRAHFRNFDDLRRHVTQRHIGTANTEINLAIMKEMMVNLVREPTGRRYGKKTKWSTLRHYRSRRSEQIKRLSNPFPMPTVGTVLNWKNDGGVEQGIDEEVLKMMHKLGQADPTLCHGVLSFDEVHVKPQKEIEPKSGVEFGKADNYSTRLAESVLVMQYISLFGKKRFAVNVAFFGCVDLNSETLEQWILTVMLALYRYGFQVHALICDGAAINRGVQHNIFANARAAGQSGCKDYVIQHPFAFHETDLLLFILSDPSHGIKKWRNCQYNRDMEFIEGENRFPIRWQHLIDVAHWQTAQLRVDRRLTRRHLEMTNFTKMTVQTAVDVMSESIVNVMLELDRNGTIGTRHYMSIGREFWLCMNNGRTFYNPDDAREVLTGLRRVAEQIRHWRDATVDEPDKFLTTETADDILLICDGVQLFMFYVWNVLSKRVPGAGFTPRTISQDPLERIFGALRQRGGGTQNITVRSLAFNLRSINCNIIGEFMQLLNVKD